MPYSEWLGFNLSKWHQIILRILNLENVQNGELRSLQTSNDSETSQDWDKYTVSWMMKEESQLSQIGGQGRLCYYNPTVEI